MHNTNHYKRIPIATGYNISKIFVLFDYSYNYYYYSFLFFSFYQVIYRVVLYYFWNIYCIYDVCPIFILGNDLFISYPQLLSSCKRKRPLISIEENFADYSTQRIEFDLLHRDNQTQSLTFLRMKSPQSSYVSPPL